MFKSKAEKCVWSDKRTHHHLHRDGLFHAIMHIRINIVLWLQLWCKKLCIHTQRAIWVGDYSTSTYLLRFVLRGGSFVRNIPCPASHERCAWKHLTKLHSYWGYFNSMLLIQSKGSNVTKQWSPLSTLLHIYEIIRQNTENVVAHLTRQAGGGDWRINLVSFLF